MPVSCQVPHKSTSGLTALSIVGSQTNEIQPSQWCSWAAIEPNDLSILVCGQNNIQPGSQLKGTQAHWSCTGEYSCICHYFLLTRSLYIGFNTVLSRILRFVPMDHSIINNSELYIENLGNESWEHQPPGNIQTRNLVWWHHYLVTNSIKCTQSLSLLLVQTKNCSISWLYIWFAFCFYFVIEMQITNELLHAEMAT